MKIKQKIFLIIFMIGILICNSSYAASISIEQLEASIQNLFSKNITILTTASGAEGNTTSTRKIAASNVALNNSQIQITEATSGQSVYISYKIEGEICKFESTIDLSQIDTTDIDPTILQAMLPIYQATYLELCYLTTAHALGADLSLVDTYYYQKTNGQSGTVQTDVFTYTQSANNNISKVSLDINLTELNQLNSSKIDASSSCEVTVEGLDGGTTPTPEEPSATPTPTSTPTPTATPTPIATSTPTPTPQPSKGTNTNQSTTDIPKAGLEDNILIAIVVVIVIGLFFYIKNKENQDIM